MKSMTEKIEKAVKPIAERYGQELVGVSFGNNSKGRIVKISVGSKTGPGIDQLTSITKDFNELIGSTGDEIINFNYQLEVSSPGIDRDLKTDRDFEWNMGKELKVKLSEGEKNRKIKGILKGFTKDDIQIDTGKGVEMIKRSHIIKAKLVIKF